MPKLDAPIRTAGPNIPDLAELTREPKQRVSYSELATFRDCPLKWQLRYVYRLDPPAKSPRLDMGSAWHIMLQAHYDAIAAGLSKDATRVEVLRALNDFSDTTVNVGTDEFGILMWMYDDYVRIYGSDHKYEIIATEADFEFPFPVDGAEGLVFVGKIDLETINRETGSRQVWDHKSASGRNVSKDGFLNEMLLEDQFILYAAAKRAQGQPVSHVVYNAARTDKLKRAMLDEERYARAFIPYSDAALDAVWEDARRAATALVAMWNDPERPYSVPNPRQCGWKCEYQRSHIEGRNAGRDVVDVALDYGFTFRQSGEPEVQETDPPAW